MAFNTAFAKLKRREAQPSPAPSKAAQSPKPSDEVERQHAVWDGIIGQIAAAKLEAERLQKLKVENDLMEKEIRAIENNMKRLESAKNGYLKDLDADIDAMQGLGSQVIALCECVDTDAAKMGAGSAKRMAGRKLIADHGANKGM
ncbi:hypothetical protein LTR66_011030 [Elasticomyces elasticus]|nr:hypothetical protein LTR66_011030 [Elasticomyces elasticus]